MRSLLILAAVASLAAATEIPTGTQLELRLTSALNTSTAKAKQPFDAVLIVPVMNGDNVVLSAGTKLSGHIQDVKQAAKADDQAELALAFDHISDAAGKKASLAARLVSVDNARESVDDQGKILGIIAAQTGSGRMDQGISKVSERYPGLGDLLGAVKQAVVKETDANIDYEPGVEMTIELTKPLTWNGAARSLDVKSIEPAERLAALVNRQPFQTLAEKPARPSDITNLMFLGNADEIAAAFKKAGWAIASQLTSQSKLETFRAIVELRGYSEAPVSILFLDGQPPDLVFQKQNNTFAARHHLRIWKRPGKFDGKDVWVSSSTHDIGIDFSQENRTFIHKVDSQIDRERAKVVNDLLFTGLVSGLALVERPEVPHSLYNATGDQLQTDGKIAVVEF